MGVRPTPFPAQGHPGPSGTYCLEKTMKTIGLTAGGLAVSLIAIYVWLLATSPPRLPSHCYVEMSRDQRGSECQREDPR